MNWSDKWTFKLRKLKEIEIIILIEKMALLPVKEIHTNNISRWASMAKEESTHIKIHKLLIQTKLTT